MKAFARLLEQLQTAPREDLRETLLMDYFGRVPQSDLGWAVAVLCGSVSLKKLSPAQLGPLISTRVDPLLLELSQAHVGDLTDTIALLWPARPGANREPELAELVTSLQTLDKAAVMAALPAWLDALDASGRWTLLKLVSADLKTGVTPRSVRQALARWAGQPLAELEEIWHSQAPPYEDLLAWLAGGASRPTLKPDCAFRSPALAAACAEDQLAGLNLEDHQVEWKWHGHRVQLLANGAAPARLFTKEGEDISLLFPDVLAGVEFEAVLDGELLVADSAPQGSESWRADGRENLDKRLNRKRLDKKLLSKAPAFVRLFDLLIDAGEDLRDLPLQARRARLERCLEGQGAANLDLSPLLPSRTPADLEKLRQISCETGRDGLVLKRRDLPYLSGEQGRPWLSLQPARKRMQALLLYVERPSQRSRAAIASCTIGLWQHGAEGLALVPLGKVAMDLPETEVRALENWVKEHQQDKFGPVRSVTPSLVMEVSYEALLPAPRRKAGVQLRAAKLQQISWQAEASNLPSLNDLLSS